MDEPQAPVQRSRPDTKQQGTAVAAVDMCDQLIGGLVQAYVFARYDESSNARIRAHLGKGLGPLLRERIDALGVESKRLLEVNCGRVVDELVKLEGLGIEKARKMANHGG